MQTFELFDFDKGMTYLPVSICGVLLTWF